MYLQSSSYVFICRSLFNMRSFIHINLCINLAIAQVIFVIGVNRFDSLGDNVPVPCQVIAVILHYFFLVSFMWMLVEGVVLYIILIKVFVTDHEKRYMLLFTIASYGVPMLYLGLLSLPIGFGLSEWQNYGYEATEQKARQVDNPLEPSKIRKDHGAVNI